jgi:uncharacterized protein YlxW (UPF0749 family)
VRLLGHHARKVKPLEEEKAVKLGAEVISEFMVFGVAGLTVIFEYSRSQIAAAQKKEKEEKLMQEKEDALEMRLLQLETALVDLKAHNDRAEHRLEQTLKELSNSIKQSAADPR